MKVGEKLIVREVKGCMEFNIAETLRLLKHNPNIFFSWGAHALKNFWNMALRFNVSGHHHKGHVYVFLNASDLYVVYFTNRRGKILDIKEGIYFDMLVETIDNYVEYVEAYA